jgi:hypothetical protein
MVRGGALRLLHGSSLHQRPDVAVELLLMRIRKLRQIAQEHYFDGDVLAGPCKLQGTNGVRVDGLLDLSGCTPVP